MNKKISLARASQFLLVALLVGFMTSCGSSSKYKDLLPEPPKDTTVVVKPVPTGSISILYSGNPERVDTPFLNEIGTVSASAQNAYSDSTKWYKGIDTLATGLSVNFPASPATGFLTYGGVAKGPGGTGWFSKTTKAPFSSTKSNLCWNKTYQNDTLMFAQVPDSGFIPTTGWVLWQAGLDPFKLKYQTNNLVEVFNSSGVSQGTRPYFLQANETKIWKGPDNVWVLQSISATRHVLLQWRKLGSNWFIYQEIWNKM